MGIHGIYKEIGPGERIALAKLAIEKFEQTGRPLRIAIDISIWLFQIQSGKGGTNPALRTFYYRLLRLMSLSIHPLFVFDGPNKPPFKRNKRIGPNVASIPEFLAKQLLKQFGFPFHIAPGEAEAECALLQREGIVDAVLSEDVDTLMFGSELTFRNWSPEVNKSKIPTHVNVYESEKTKNGPSGLDRGGMVLVALMSGGDYIPEGVPGCGPKLACEAARAGFGHELCKIQRKDKVGFRSWRERLEYELHTNESKFFKRRHGALKIPADFPNIEVLGYYTNPVISTKAQLNKLRERLKWDQDINFAELRTFTAEAFDWTKLGGAKKFVRNLAPVTLFRNLRLRAQSSEVERQEAESNLIKAIHGKRNHASTDCMTELRVSFRPLDLVPIDLESEEPDDDLQVDESDVGNEEEEATPAASQTGNEPTKAPGDPAKKRSPSNYDPTQLEKIWIFESIVKAGAPMKVQDWEESFRDARKYLAMKHTTKATGKKNLSRKEKATQISLDQFTKVMKTGQPSFVSSSKPDLDKETPTTSHSSPPSRTSFRIPQQLSSFTSTTGKDGSEIIELLSSSPTQAPQKKSTTDPIPEVILKLLPNTITKRRRSRLRRAQTDSATLEPTELAQPPSTPPFGPTLISLNSSPLTSPSNGWPSKRSKLDIVDLTRDSSNALRSPSKLTRRRSHSLLSSPANQSTITHYFSPLKNKKQLLEENLEAASSIPIGCKFVTKSRNGAAGRDDKKGQETCMVPGRRKLKELSTNVEINPSCASFKMPPIFGAGDENCDKEIFNFDEHTEASPEHNPASNSTATTLRLSLGMHNMSPTKQNMTADKPLGMRKKEVIRIRESLEGTFAIEEVDLTTVDNRVPGTRTHGIKDTKTFRMSEISVVDLTS